LGVVNVYATHPHFSSYKLHINRKIYKELVKTSHLSLKSLDKKLFSVVKAKHPSKSVPEPGTVGALLGLSAVGFFSRRRKSVKQ